MLPFLFFKKCSLWKISTGLCHLIWLPIVVILVLSTIKQASSKKLTNFFPIPPVLCLQLHPSTSVESQDRAEHQWPHAKQMSSHRTRGHARGVVSSVWSLLHLLWHIDTLNIWSDCCTHSIPTKIKSCIIKACWFRLYCISGVSTYDEFPSD